MWKEIPAKLSEIEQALSQALGFLDILENPGILSFACPPHGAGRGGKTLGLLSNSQIVLPGPTAGAPPETC